MKSVLFKSALCGALALQAACGAHTVTRAQDAPLVFYEQNDPAQELVAQADALRKMADAVMRQAALRGAAQGAALGCGIGLATRADMSRCLTGAAVAGTAGGLLGHAKGRKQVDQALQSAATELDGQLQGIAGQTARVSQSLTAVLAEQDRQIAALKMRRETGVMTSGQYSEELAEIRKLRAAVAMQLDASMQAMSQTSKALRDTSDRRSTDLNTQIEIAKGVEADIASARQSIRLF